MARGEFEFTFPCLRLCINKYRVLVQMDHKTMMSIYKLLPKTMSMDTQIERTKAARLIMTLLVQNISLENIPEWFAEAYMVSD